MMTASDTPNLGPQIDGAEAREAEKLRRPHTMPLSSAFEILELLLGLITDNT